MLPSAIFIKFALVACEIRTRTFTVFFINNTLTGAREKLLLVLCKVDDWMKNVEN